MNIEKSAISQGGVTLDQGELAAINQQAKAALGAEEVYAFTIKLCDNEIDRDAERFPVSSLHTLATLFVGKSGIFDHDWSAKAQCARIYRTEVVTTGEKNSLNEPYTYLKGWAYMLRGGKNAELIAEIEGGIKREVSVSCAAEKKCCSVCGESLDACRHTPGKAYQGTLCYGDLVGICDAYEWSFVAVPAQTAAGVLKAKRQEEKPVELKEFVQREPALAAQVEQLEREAETGRQYLKTLRAEVERLGSLATPGTGEVMKAACAHLDAEALLALKGAYEVQLEQRYPPKTQLPGNAERLSQRASDAAFQI